MLDRTFGDTLACSRIKVVAVMPQGRVAVSTKNLCRLLDAKTGEALFELVDRCTAHRFVNNFGWQAVDYDGRILCFDNRGLSSDLTERSYQLRWEDQDGDTIKVQRKIYHRPPASFKLGRLMPGPRRLFVPSAPKPAKQRPRLRVAG